MPEGAPSLSEAAAAMQGALVEANVEAPTPPEATPVVAEVTPENGTPATPVEATVPNLDGIDFTQPLTEADVKKIQDGFLRQQDYTKKTQEVAPYRKFIEEAGTDLEQVRKSVEFVNRLENDPDFLKQVASELAELANNGEPTGTEQPLVTPENTGSDPQLVKTVQEMNAWIARKEAEEANAVIVKEWETKIQTAENAIRESNPAYDQEDIDTLYELLPAHNYDMFAAQEYMEKFRNRIENKILKPKLNHPGAANPVAAGSLATSPKDVTTFEQAAAIMRERLRQEA